MTHKIYQALLEYSKLVNKKDIFQKYDSYHELYLQLKSLLNLLNFKRIGFINKEQDDIDFYASIDDLIKENKEVYLSYDSEKELKFSRVNSLEDEFYYVSGNRVYKNKTPLNQKLDILIVPVNLINNKNEAIIFQNHKYRVLKNSKVIMIAVGFKEALRDIDNLKTHTNVIECNYKLLV